ncbi:Calcium-transporting P-type ATPase, subfamily IIB [Artemisia annua]|uniref:Calcium-transporting ATPase n=1 Tax=Artemisia annua TaxID=35608 RepID=A0A2U1PRI7_ARTAN|nr:Calcium-transporting P-type ATPase, subfamily IIB [Artemisia annua]
MSSNKVQSSCEVGALLYNRSTITLTGAQKRWRRAYFSIHFSNTMSTIAKVANKRFPSIDRTDLTNLVERKDLNMLQKFNGVEGLAKSLHTTLENGIMSHDIEKRRTAFGSNTYEQPAQRGFFPFMMEAFRDTTILILLVCAILSLVFGFKDNGAKDGWYEAAGIFVMASLIITVSAVTNFKQEKQFDCFFKISNTIQIDAIREGRRQKISLFDVVVGDVIPLNIGDQVPADGVIINEHSLLIDESSVTGESDHIDINAIKNPFLFSGSKVADGHGQMLVLSVGMNTTWGKMMSSITGDCNEQTPIRSRINKLASLFAKVGLLAVILDCVISAIRYCTGYTKDKNGNWNYNGKCTDTNDILNSFTRAVVATTEGIPLAVILTLACCMKGMMFDQAMVRKPSACETMGAVTVICTDKTGTLTLNQMKVTNFWVGLDLIENNSAVDAKVLELYRQGVGLNTTGNVYKSVAGAAHEYCGSPTEKAILSWAVTELGMDIDKVKRNSTILDVKTFNSEKKRSGVSARKKEDESIHLHWKGAAEIVLAMCSNYCQKNGLIKSIDHEDKSRFEKLIQGMAAHSLRCIAFAHTQIPKDGTYKTLNEQGLTLLGIVGIKDPCRPGVREAVNACRSAGLSIKMITGDNVFTAKAIATECGILEAGQQVIEGEVIEGEEFQKYTEEERMKKVDSIRVMARSSPFDKLLMVQCLKKKGHVVAVTGHAIDDAPALKEADIGISMGIEGTEAARENSDLVILNGDFASVVLALMWGRCVQNNIQKFFQFQLTANVVALVINFVKAASAGGTPLMPVQLLLVNIIINTLGALALGTERPTKELMHEPPVARSAPLITNVMWRNLLTQSLFQIICQVSNKFNSRQLEKRNVFEGIHKSYLFLGIIGVTITLQVVMVEFLSNFADTEKLDPEHWGICIAIAALSLAIGWSVKMMPVPDTPMLNYIEGWI